MTASPKPQTHHTGTVQAEVPAHRSRDAARTRRLLLDAARRRFANDGYAATTVRHIADDAGVNVALINRYFESKEGLLAACLSDAIEDLRQTTRDEPLDALPETLAAQLAGSGAEGRHQEHLLLLLRSSGDERADQIRLGVLRAYSERIASKAGWEPGDTDSDDLLLRAQIILCAAIGIVLLRSAGMQPLASTHEHTLAAPLRDLVNAMFPLPRR
jgi:AcrR family transcriptional regulator